MAFAFPDPLPFDLWSGFDIASEPVPVGDPGLGFSSSGFLEDPVVSSTLPWAASSDAFNNTNCEFSHEVEGHIIALQLLTERRKAPLMPMNTASATLFQAPGSITTNPASTPSDLSGQLTPPNKHKLSPDADPDVLLKRQRNTIAARKYRQKRLDRIAELELALKEMTSERDDLKLKLARQEAETSALRELMRSRPS